MGSIREAGDEYMKNHVRPDPVHVKLERMRTQIRAVRRRRKIKNDTMAYRAYCYQASRQSLNPIPMFIELFSQPFKLFRRTHA